MQQSGQQLLRGVSGPPLVGQGGRGQWTVSNAAQARVLSRSLLADLRLWNQ